MLKHGMTALVLILLATSAHALPDASQDVWYYDSQGNVIGWFTLSCNGQRSSGGTTSSIYEVFSMPCQTMQPITCADNGMSELSGCDGWCYSSGYVMSYNYDMVPDCGGVCTFGEGPGASGSMWCSTCWKGTGSCPAKTRGGWKAPPSLTAALQSKVWSVLASLRK